MLIFILPSSLYLRITNQDGDKGTQRIWVCLLPATLIFLIGFSAKLAGKQSPNITFSCIEGCVGPLDFPVGDRDPFPSSRSLFQCGYDWALPVFSPRARLAGEWMFPALCLCRVVPCL